MVVLEKELLTNLKNISENNTAKIIDMSDEELESIDEEYCTYGDKIHADENPKVFRDCNGVFMYDSDNTLIWIWKCGLHLVIWATKINVSETRLLTR